MAYFPHAFRKILVGSNGFVGDGSAHVSTLTAGQIGIVDPDTNLLIDIDGSVPTYKALPMFYIAQGSFYTSDKIGPFHGGYQETVKSKGINPKYVTAFYRTSSNAATPHVIKIGDVRVNNASPVVEFAWGTNYYLRVDVKGLPALGLLGHNAYLTAQAYTECEVAGSTPSQALPFELWTEHINNDPIMSQLINAYVVYQTWNGSAWVTTTESAFNNETNETIKRAYMTLTAAYVDTVFGDCSFKPTDYYQVEPLLIYASVVDESGDPCNVDLFGDSSEAAPAAQATGLGETIIRDLILFNRYRQEQFSTHPRMREVLKDPTLDAINRNDRYITYNILHSVPRFNNPTGTFDNDQYLVTIVIPDGDGVSIVFETMMQGILDNAGSGVVMQTNATVPKIL